MSIRAPRRDPGIHDVPEEHVVLGHWEPSRYYRVICLERVLAESSDPDDWGMTQALAQRDAILQRSWHFVPAVVQWHQVDTPPTPTLLEDHHE